MSSQSTAGAIMSFLKRLRRLIDLVFTGVAYFVGFFAYLMLFTSERRGAAADKEPPARPDQPIL